MFGRIAIVVEVIPIRPLQKAEGEFLDGDLALGSRRGQFAIVGEVFGNQLIVFCPAFLTFVLAQIECFAP